MSLANRGWIDHSAVPISELTSREAVLYALEEFDRIGRQAFLEKYGFGSARDYFLRRDGRLYDSKAIVGAAIGFEHPDRGQMPSSEFSGGDATVRAKLEELGFEVTGPSQTPTSGSPRELVLPQVEVDAFAAYMETPEYAKDERNYKLAVHYVLRSLFSEERLASPEFPALLSAFFGREWALDELVDKLRLSPEERDFIEVAVNSPSGVTNAFANLCGGGFGVNNFTWIPGAVEDGLGEGIRQAFGVLFATGPRVSEAIDRFRSEDMDVQRQAQELPSWHENWQIRRPSLAYVAALLGAVHPQRFTFYAATKLRPAYEELLGRKWPRGMGGQGYEQVVDFVTDVRSALEQQGAPVRDMIDAQSFLWLRKKFVAGDRPASSRAWIFQANPRIYDVDGALRSLSQDDWLVRQHRREIHEGDRAYIWRSGDDPGIVAVATVLSEPEERLGNPDSEPFNRAGDQFGAAEPRVLISIDRVLDAPISRKTMLDDEVLRDLQIIRQRQGTNFAVTPEQDERLRALLDQTAVSRRYFILQQRVDRGYGWDEEGRVYHFTPKAAGAWKRLSESPGAAFVYYRPGSGGGETARTYFGFGRISRIDEEMQDGERQFLAHVVDYQPLPRPVPAAEYDPRPNVQMSIAEIGQSEYEELLRRGGAAEERVPSYREPPLEEVTDAILNAGLVLSERTIRRYHLSLKTRGFVVLSGVSGTGKTWLAQAYADAVNAKALVVPVAPNWTTNEDLLGYLSPLDRSYHDTPFSQFLRDAGAEWEIARGQGRTAWPFHLILDEMNLARVEYYFAKFLSAMEIRARAGSAVIELAPGDVVPLGSNLSFIGTVNVDETTQMFADKVFDRAQLVELDISRADLAKRLEGAPYRQDLLEIWGAVREVAPFAFRTADEIRGYVHEAERLGVSWQEAFDEQLFQKVLPKLKGGDLRVEVALQRLVEITADAYPLTHGKARAMLDGFAQHGFSSYF
jgi:hypothetical protein